MRNLSNYTIFHILSHDVCPGESTDPETTIVFTLKVL